MLTVKNCSNIAVLKKVKEMYFTLNSLLDNGEHDAWNMLVGIVGIKGAGVLWAQNLKN